MTDSARLDRQEQIWAGLFGPARAGELIEQARAKIGSDAGVDLEAVLRSMDQALHDDDDADEAGTMRPI